MSFSLALDDDTDPSPQDTVAFDAAITAHRVRVVVYNAQVVDAQTERTEQLARAPGRRSSA